jgi:hypothetical protein
LGEKQWPIDESAKFDEDHTESGEEESKSKATVLGLCFFSFLFSFPSLLIKFKEAQKVFVGNYIYLWCKRREEEVFI